MDLPELTDESIAAARQQQRQDRAAVEQATGIRIREDGCVQLTPPVIVHCTHPGCGYKASGRRDGQVLRSVVAHIVKAHR